MPNTNFEDVINTVHNAISLSPKFADDIGTNTKVLQFRKWGDLLIETFPIITVERASWAGKRFELGRSNLRTYSLIITAMIERMDHPNGNTGDPWLKVDRVAENIVSVLEADLKFGGAFYSSEVVEAKYGKMVAGNDQFWVKSVSIDFNVVVRFIYTC